MGERSGPRVPESEEAVIDRNEKSQHGRHSEPDAKRPRPDASNDDNCQANEQTDDGLREKQPTDRRDVAVAEVLPKMEMEITRPDNENPAYQERQAWRLGKR